MRILLVEDDEAIAGPLERALVRAAYEVSAVSTGTLALRKHGDADLVLLDLGLPDMDGFEVCRRISGADGSKVPIIVLSARGREIDRVRPLEAGADDYLVKPSVSLNLSPASEGFLVAVASETRRHRKLQKRNSTVRCPSIFVRGRCIWPASNWR